MIKCKICDCEKVHVEYKGIIRDGGLGKYTRKPVTLYRCEKCDVIWHESDIDEKDYYESTQYRMDLENTTSEEDFYRLHDFENTNKITYTGSTIFRGKTIADIGCGGGAFLDFVSGTAKEAIAIEPSRYYREVLQRKGYTTYAYAMDAVLKYSEKIDVITSFDVIEHVENPQKFIEDYYSLLSKGGIGIIGTPTDAPVMREIIGEVYERTQLFSTQHLWVLGKSNLQYMAEKVGFKNIEFKYFQRYGMSNFLGWVRDKKSNSEIRSKSITQIMDSTWKLELERNELADYIVMYLRK